MDKDTLKQTIHQIVTDHIDCDPNIYTDLKVFDNLEIMKTDNLLECCFQIINYKYFYKHPVLVMMEDGDLFYHETAHYITNVSPIFDFLIEKGDKLDYFCVKDLIYYIAVNILDLNPKNREKRTFTTITPNADAWSGYFYILNEAFSQYIESVYNSQDLSKYCLENYLGKTKIFPKYVPDKENKLFCDFRDKVLIPFKENKTYDVDTIKDFGIKFHKYPNSSLIHEIGFMLSKKVSDDLENNKITKQDIGKYFIKDLIEFSFLRFNYAFKEYNGNHKHFKKRKQFFSSIQDLDMDSTELKYNPMNTFIELYMR